LPLLKPSGASSFDIPPERRFGHAQVAQARAAAMLRYSFSKLRRQSFRRRPLTSMASCSGSAEAARYPLYPRVGPPGEPRPRDLAEDGLCESDIADERNPPVAAFRAALFDPFFGIHVVAPRFSALVRAERAACRRHVHSHYTPVGARVQCKEGA